MQPRSPQPRSPQPRNLPPRSLQPKDAPPKNAHSRTFVADHSANHRANLKTGAIRRRIVDLLAEAPQTQPSAIVELVRRDFPLIPLHEVNAFVANFALGQATYGAIDAFLADPAVEEILINGPGPIWLDAGGRLQKSDVSVSRYELDVLIERLLGPSGLRATRSAPIVDAMLVGGSRVNVVLPPLSVAGPSVCIRKFGAETLPVEAFGPPALVAVLDRLVTEGKSLLVVGATSSGKTSLLNALSRLIPANQRVVCIEDRAELQIEGEHVVNLEARPKNSEGVGAVDLRDLIKTALRMRPDRIIVGEVRGPEALDLLLAMTTGHAGSMSTCHAATAQGGLRRLATLAGLAEATTSMEVIERTVFEAVDAVVVLRRNGGIRYIETIHAIPAEPVREADLLPTLWSASSVAPPRSASR